MDQTLELIDNNEIIKSNFQECVLNTAGAYPPDDIDDVFSVSYYYMDKWNHWLITDNIDNLCHRCFKEYLTGGFDYSSYQTDKEGHAGKDVEHDKKENYDDEEEDEEDEDW